MSKKATAPSTIAPDSIGLAWSLAELTAPHLSALERDRIYIAIGSGETFSAIEALITAVAQEQVPLGVHLVATVTTWLDCHAGHDAQPRLREFMSEVKTISPPQVSAADPPGRYLAGSAEHGRGVHTQSQNRAQETQG